MEPERLPEAIQKSPVLTEAHRGLLLSVPGIPLINPAYQDDHLRQIVQYYGLNPDDMDRELQIHAAALLDQGRIDAAWQVLLSGLG